MFLNLITGSESTAKSIKNQLMRVFDSKILIEAFILEKGGTLPEKRKITIFSSNAAYLEFCEKYGKNIYKNFIVSGRDIDLTSLDKVLNLPTNQKILVVNDSVESAFEAVDSLRRLGFDYLNLVMYYPECKVDTKSIEIAITTGELDKVPKEIKQVFDLGSRVMDFKSIYKVMKLLNSCDEYIESFFESNNETLIKVATRATNISRENDILSNMLKEKSQSRGHEAKYKLDDIVGRSYLINETKFLASKLAKTELTILIEGESGTGKELFANAIHNESGRKKFPFLAVNFSALPDSLMESELFGYEEGSFTGAKKGGKKGLFELANGGTIFLDEIGDISLKMQTRLLRVIQEKEIMRIGSNKIIPIDVRIIAATNKNLRELINEKRFREDLYYRLKVGHMIIPPLRERKEDIEEIVMLEIKKNQRLTISKEAIESLKNNTWYGNVRELKNALEFAIAVSEDDYIDYKDVNSINHEFGQNESIISSEVDNFLKVIKTLNTKEKIASRASIKKEIESKGENITEYRIRQLIKISTSENLITKNKGSYGMNLTIEGEKKLAKSQINNQ